MKWFCIIFCMLSLFPLCSAAQEPEPFAGKWYFELADTENATQYRVQLHIASPEQHTLYPAELSLQYGNFKAVYHVLLVQKNKHELVIGRQKIPQQETPFGIGNYTIPLNGSLQLMNQALQVRRIAANRFGFAVPALSVYTDSNKLQVLRISQFLKEQPISFKKISDEPWRSGTASRMLYTHGSTDYFGLTDSFYVHQANGVIRFSEQLRNDDDSVSVMLNRKMIIDNGDLNQLKSPQGIQLDTGLNILCFFADNYGRVPPNTAKMQLDFGSKKFLLDYTSLQNMSANFIVAKIFLLRENETAPDRNSAKPTIDYRKETRQTKWIDSITATSQEVTLAFWDDAVEDGDSISLQINDEIFMPGLAVKKQPKFVKIKLYPGENKIIFIADNLGSIAPNTAMLEIIDGKKRRNYTINTDMGQNNALKITYHLGP